MAVVYLARDTELERPVAIKLLADNLARDDAFRERFLREARLAARLSHPNVVQVFDAGDDEDRPYIVMEYVEGTTLAEELRRHGSVSPERAVDLALQACAGLDHAHAAGLVHRDVKPQNLLLRGDGTLKIADFGIARAAETTRLTEIGTVLGTAAYLAPEQAAGEDVTAAADIYSLGAVVYELLTGRPPRTFETLAELAARQSEDTIVPVRELAPDASPQLEEAVMRSLARNPAYRQDSAAGLARELAASSPEPPTEPLPQTRIELPTTPYPVRRARRRRPRLALAAALALVAIAIAIGVALASGGGSSPRPPATVAPVPRGTSPAAEARNLAAWLRAHAR